MLHYDENNFFYNFNSSPLSDYKRKNVVLLDRDGVIIEEKHYLRDPNNIEFIDGSLEALEIFRDLNLFVGVVSNQAGIAKGILSIADVLSVNLKFFELLANKNVYIDCYMFCPFHPDGIVPQYSKQSLCRKPGPGMFDFMSKFYSLKPEKLYIVGDKESDVQMGNNIGAESILVKTGYGNNEGMRIEKEKYKILVFNNLLEASKWIKDKQLCR